MRPWHWALLGVGLVMWSVLVVLWMTGPYNCSVPDDHGAVRCQ